jgi:predicted flap endonuclease-1-like 5' DNA nuclease
MPAETKTVTNGTPLPSIGRPATQALELAGVTRLEQLSRFSEAELLALHGVGPKAIRLLNEALHAHGLAFRGKSSPT